MAHLQAISCPGETALLNAVAYERSGSERRPRPAERRPALSLASIRAVLFEKVIISLFSIALILQSVAKDVSRANPNV